MNRSITANLVLSGICGFSTPQDKENMEKRSRNSYAAETESTKISVFPLSIFNWNMEIKRRARSEARISIEYWRMVAELGAETAVGVDGDFIVD